MALAEKTFDSNALPQLLQSLFGTKTTTKTGGSSSTSSSSANTAPLQQVFDSASKPMDQQLYDNLIASVFQKAAGQVPTLTAALANATGSRSSNNSPLALALNEQNNMAAKDAVTAILSQQNTQQQIAGNAASQIAGATKSETKTIAPSTETKKAGSAVNPLATTALGFLLNQADKKGLFGKIGDMFTTAGPASNFPVSAPSFGTSLGGPTTSFAAPASFMDSGVGGGVSLAGEFGGQNLGDFSSMFGGGDLGSFDFGSLLGGNELGGSGNLDFTSLLGSDYGGFDLGGALGGSDIYGGIDVGSFFGGGGSAFSDMTAGGGFGALPDDIWNFFANGGMTNKNSSAPPPQVFKIVDTQGNTTGSYANRNTANAAVNRLNAEHGSYKYRIMRPDGSAGYANGGNTAPVVRNRNNMGVLPTLYGQSAINVSPNSGGNGGLNSDALMTMIQRAVQQGQVKAAPAARAPASAPAMGASGNDLEGDYREDAGGAINTMAGNPLGNKVGTAMAMAALSMMMPGITGTLTQNPTAAQLTGPAMKAAGVGGSPLSALMAIAQATQAQGAATSAINNAEDPLGALLGAINAVQGSAKAGDISAVGSDNLAAGANAVSSVTGIDPLDALMQSTNSFGTGTNSDALALGANNAATRNGIDPLDALMAGTNAFGTGPDGGGSGNDGSGAGLGLGGDGASGPGEFVNGGKNTSATRGMIRGPGTGTSDSITAISKVPGKGNIKVSDREFIVPADVVAKPGVQAMLEQLLAAYHTPV